MTAECNQDPPADLSAVLYFLHNTLDVYAPERYEIIRSELMRPHYKEDLENYREATRWALRNPNFDFKSYADVYQNNNQIVYFIKELDAVLNEIA